MADTTRRMMRAQSTAVSASSSRSTERSMNSCSPWVRLLRAVLPAVEDRSSDKRAAPTPIQNAAIRLDSVKHESRKGQHRKAACSVRRSDSSEVSGTDWYRECLSFSRKSRRGASADPLGPKLGEPCAAERFAVVSHVREPSELGSGTMFSQDALVVWKIQHWRRAGERGWERAAMSEGTFIRD